MKDISLFFQALPESEERFADCFGERIIRHTEGSFPELEKNSVALFYVPEYRNAGETFEYTSNDEFRKALNKLHDGFNWNFHFYDLGTIIPGKKLEDTYAAVKKVVEELLKANVLPIIIGGTQDLLYPIFQAYEHQEQMINILSVDSELNLGNVETAVNSQGFVSQLLMHRPNYLFNYCAIGLQAPYVHKAELELFGKLYFDVVRLGEFNADKKIAEPHMRNADFINFDLTVLRSSDIKGKIYQRPNGLYAEDLCQLAKYSGISDKLSVFALLNYFSSVEEDNSQLLAEIIWYFLEGFSARFGDFPVGTRKKYAKFSVLLSEIEGELNFFKSDKSGRWWMEVPYPATKGVKYERHHLIPCDKADYIAATHGEIPSLWWKTMQKLG